MKPDRDTYDDKYRPTDPPPSDAADSLFGPAFAADGDPTSFNRERPNGRFVGPDAPDTGFGVDRNQSGRFASQSREPVPQIRDADGTIKSDAFAVGNGGAFDDEYDWGESP